MQPGSLGTQDSEGWVRAEGLSLLKLEIQEQEKKEKMYCAAGNTIYIAILTSRIISRSQAACRSDMET